MEFCVCERDLDGQCLPCKERIFTAFRVFKDLLFKYMEDMRGQVIEPLQGGNCDGCSRQYTDAATATVVRFMVSEIPSEDQCRMLVGEFAKLLRSQGIMETPHLQKVWIDVCAKNGWSPV